MYIVMVAIAKQFSISTTVFLWLGNITNQITDWIDFMKRLAGFCRSRPCRAMKTRLEERREKNAHQPEYIKIDMMRREYEIWSTSSCRTDAITKHQVYIYIIVLYHCECQTRPRPVHFSQEETIAITITQCNNRFHKIRMKIHCKFDWIHIFYGIQASTVVCSTHSLSEFPMLFVCVL